MKENNPPDDRLQPDCSLASLPLEKLEGGMKDAQKIAAYCDMAVAGAPVQRLLAQTVIARFVEDETVRFFMMLGAGAAAIADRAAAELERRANNETETTTTA